MIPFIAFNLEKIPYLSVQNTQTTHVVVPFYSQFADIQSAEWRKVGCGITSLAMLIKYYNPEQAVSAQKLLIQGINAGAYIEGAGWSHQGLINVAKKHGLDGQTYGLANLTNQEAFNKFKDIVKEGPAIVSVHYKMEPTNPIPHLVVVTAIEGDFVYYNDPAGKAGDQKISSADFMKAWKKRFIVIREIATV